MYYLVFRESLSTLPKQRIFDELNKIESKLSCCFFVCEKEEMPSVELRENIKVEFINLPKQGESFEALITKHLLAKTDLNGYILCNESSVFTAETYNKIIEKYSENHADIITLKTKIFVDDWYKKFKTKIRKMFARLTRKLFNYSEFQGENHIIFFSDVVLNLQNITNSKLKSSKLNPFLMVSEDVVYVQSLPKLKNTNKKTSLAKVIIFSATSAIILTAQILLNVFLNLKFIYNLLLGGALLINICFLAYYLMYLYLESRVGSLKQ